MGSKRVLLRIGLAVTAGVLAVVTAGPAPAAALTAAWRADGYDSTNSGFNPRETAITESTVAQVKNRWSIVSPVVADSCSAQAPPVVADGRLFMADQGGIAAYDAATGAQLWTLRLADVLEWTTPRLVVIGSRLVAARNYCRSASDPDGHLMTFDVATGELVWFARRDAPMNVLLVDRGVVVVSGADIAVRQVSGYRLRDGAVLWHRDDELLGQPVAFGGRLLLTRFPDGGSDTVRVSNGTVVWSSEQSYQALAAAPAGKRVYAQAPDGALVALEANTGAVAWSVAGAGTTSIAVDDASVYVAVGDHITAYLATSGAPRWSSAAGSGPFGKPVVAGGLVYLTHSVVDVLRTSDGGLVNSPTFTNVMGHPVIVNGRVYVTDGSVLNAFTL